MCPLDSEDSEVEKQTLSSANGVLTGPFCLQKWAFCKQLLSSQPSDFQIENRLKKGRVVGPDVMQSGFGVNFLFGLANCRKIAGEFSANFDGEF